MHHARIKIIETNGCDVYEVGQQLIFTDDQIYQGDHKICWRMMQPIISHLSLLMRGIELEHGELPNPDCILQRCSECGPPLTDKGPVVWEFTIDKQDAVKKEYSNERYRLIVHVYRIDGQCPVHKVGDQFEISEPGLRLTAAQEICFPMLANIMTVFRPLARGVPPEELGLGPQGEICCHDVGPEYGYPGQVHYRIERVPVEELPFDEL